MRSRSRRPRCHRLEPASGPGLTASWLSSDQAVLDPRRGDSGKRLSARASLLLRLTAILVPYLKFAATAQAWLRTSPSTHPGASPELRIQCAP